MASYNNKKRQPPLDAKNWENVDNKFKKYFSEKPGE